MKTNMETTLWHEVKRKVLSNQKINSSMCLELSDREAEALQGGAASAREDLKAIMDSVKDISQSGIKYPVIVRFDLGLLTHKLTH